MACIQNVCISKYSVDFSDCHYTYTISIQVEIEVKNTCFPIVFKFASLRHLYISFLDMYLNFTCIFMHKKVLIKLFPKASWIKAYKFTMILKWVVWPMGFLLSTRTSYTCIRRKKQLLVLVHKLVIDFYSIFRFWICCKGFRETGNN